MPLKDAMIDLSRPNLVYIFPDQFRQQAVGCMGQDPVVTPNLDRLASEGLVFTHAVSNFPVCSPYRAMLFSGKYPFSNGVIGNSYSKTVPYGIELKESERCFSDVLHDAGYSQGYIGKLHLDLPKEEDYPHTEGWRGKPGESTVWDAYTPPGPRRHGFDFWHSYGCCDQHLNPHYWEGDAKVNERIDPHEWSVKHETDVAVDYIHNREAKHRDADKPFSLFVAYNPPHTPFDQVPPECLEAYDGKTDKDLLNRPNVVLEGEGEKAGRHAKNYFAAVTGIDENVGRILDALEAEGLKENTIVVFTADHGEMMGSHGLMHKNVCYNESLLVPFIVRWPGHIDPGMTNLLLSVPDIYPSLLTMMGYGDRIPEGVEGRDLSAAFIGGDYEAPTSALFLVAHPERPDLNYRGLRTHRHTLAIKKLEDGQEAIQLFDNQEDPYQMKNIAEEQPEILAKMREEMNAWLRKTGDPWGEKDEG